jgi:hypothetical protein
MKRPIKNTANQGFESPKLILNLIKIFLLQESKLLQSTVWKVIYCLYHTTNTSYFPLALPKTTIQIYLKKTELIPDIIPANYLLASYP